METESIPAPVRPYENGNLLHIARRGWENIGDDLVIYLDTRNSDEILAYDRNLFIARMKLHPSIRRKLDDPAMLVASRTQVLQRHAIVVWFVVAFPDSYHVQLFTFDNEYRYTTNTIGIA